MTKGHFSVLAQYPSWYCWRDKLLNSKSLAKGATHRCCDQYENEGTPGVKYSGSYAGMVCTVFILQSVLFVNLSTCLVVQ
jgi:hypothetical protein